MKITKYRIFGNTKYGEEVFATVLDASRAKKLVNQANNGEMKNFWFASDFWIEVYTDNLEQYFFM